MKTTIKTIKITKLAWAAVNSLHARKHVAREAWIIQASQAGKIIVLNYKNGERIHH